MLDRYFQKFDLLSVADQIDTGTAAGRLCLNVLMSVAQWEREATGERTRDALAVKRGKGERISKDAPYGYAFTDDGRVVEDEGEQEILALIRQYHAEGLSMRRMAAELAAQGFCNRKGNPIYFTQVARIVRDMSHV